MGPGLSLTKKPAAFDRAFSFGAEGRPERACWSFSRPSRNKHRGGSYCPFALGEQLFCIVIVYVFIGVLLKGMAKNCLLSKDELLTPEIDGGMAL